MQTETGREISSVLGSCSIFHHHGDICVSLINNYFFKFFYNTLGLECINTIIKHI